MARARYYTFIETADPTTGSMLPVGSPTITIFEPGTTTPIAQTIYAGVTGGTTKSNPFTGGSDGTVEFYLDSPQRVNVRATGTGLGTITLGYEPVLADPTDVANGIRVTNVAAYGALGDGTNQTAAINRALAAWLSNPGFAGILFFPKGQYAYDNTYTGGAGIGTMLLQDIFGGTIQGEGVNNTHLWPYGSRADKWLGRHFIDGSGSFDMVIRDITIGNAALVSQNLPDSLIFVGQPAADHTSVADTIYGVSSWGTSRALGATNWLCENVRFVGPVQYGHFTHVGLTSSQMRNVTSYVDETTIVGEDNDTVDTCCFLGTRDNPMGLVASNSYPMISGNVAGNNNSNWQHTGIEYHNAIGLGGGANSNAPAMRIDEGYEYSVYPKNMSCFAPDYIRLTGGATGASTPGIGTRNLIIDGTSFYTEGAGTTALYVVNIDTQAGVTSPSTAVNGLAIRGIYAGLKASTATAALVRGVQGAVIKDMHLTAWDDSDSYTGQVVLFSGTGGKLQDSVVHCRGFGVSMGSSPASDALDGTTLFRPGTISMATHNARVFGATANQIPGLVLPQLTGTGDLITTSSPGNLARIAAGTGNFALHIVGSTPAWAASARSVLDATGAMLYASAASTLAKLAIGSSGQVLGITAGIPAWISDLDVLGWVRPMAVSGTPVANAIYRQSSIKGYALFAGATTGSHNGTTTFNVASNGITRNGTGDYTISWDRDFSSADYVVSGNAQSQGGAPLTVTIWALAAGTTQIQVQNAAATLVDATAVHIMVVGTQ